MKRLCAAIVLSTLAVIASGCTSGNLRNALGTAKNPWSVLSEPPGTLRRAQIDPIVNAHYQVLSSAGANAAGTEEETRRYIAAGFTLSDIYCANSFLDADESQRRRRFGRGMTNDVGTAIAAILGLANAGEDIVTGVATSFGLADNLWRNYDEAFVVSPDLANVRSLVLAAQDNFRERTLGRGPQASLPADYATARSAILRYAGYCSTLGMQDLLNQSASARRQQLDAGTDAQRAGQPRAQQQPQPLQPRTPQQRPQPESVGTPALTPNDGSDGGDA